jgi:hypothetical protein
MSSFATIVPLPPPIAPEYVVFVRGYHNDAFVDLLSIHSGGTPWWDLGDHPKAAIDDQVKSGHREALPQIW